MQVICKDGTTIQCQDFEAIDSGVLFFQTSRRGETEAEDEEESGSASGFVPITEVRFVLPDEMVQHQMGGQRAGVPEQGRTRQIPQGAPPSQRSQQPQQRQYQNVPQQGPESTGR